MTLELTGFSRLLPTNLNRKRKVFKIPFYIGNNHKDYKYSISIINLRKIIIEHKA